MSKNQDCAAFNRLDYTKTGGRSKRKISNTNGTPAASGAPPHEKRQFLPRFFPDMIKEANSMPSAKKIGTVKTTCGNGKKVYGAAKSSKNTVNCLQKQTCLDFETGIQRTGGQQVGLKILKSVAFCRLIYRMRGIENARGKLFSADVLKKIMNGWWRKRMEAIRRKVHAEELLPK